MVVQLERSKFSMLPLADFLVDFFLLPLADFLVDSHLLIFLVDFFFFFLVNFVVHLFSSIIAEFLSPTLVLSHCN